ncbi:unnamed protein product, partial [Mesorhabditis spiculigera]
MIGHDPDQQNWKLGWSRMFQKIPTELPTSTTYPWMTHGFPDRTSIVLMTFCTLLDTFLASFDPDNPWVDESVKSRPGTPDSEVRFVDPLPSKERERRCERRRYIHNPPPKRTRIAKQKPMLEHDYPVTAVRRREKKLTPEQFEAQAR